MPLGLRKPLIFGQVCHVSSPRVHVCLTRGTHTRLPGFGDRLWQGPLGSCSARHCLLHFRGGTTKSRVAEGVVGAGERRGRCSGSGRDEGARGLRRKAGQIRVAHSQWNRRGGRRRGRGRRSGRLPLPHRLRGTRPWRRRARGTRARGMVRSRED